MIKSVKANRHAKYLCRVYIYVTQRHTEPTAVARPLMWSVKISYRVAQKSETCITIYVNISSIVASFVYLPKICFSSLTKFTFKFSPGIRSSFCHSRTVQKLKLSSDANIFLNKL